MNNTRTRTYSLHLMLLIVCLTIETGCNTTGADSHNKSKTFARTVSITYDGQEVDAMSQAMAMDGKGGVIVTGYFMTSNSEIDIFIAHINNQGKLLWQKTFGSKNKDLGRDIIRTARGDFVVTGKMDHSLFLLRINRQGQVIWKHTYHRTNAPATDSTEEYHSPDDGYAVVQTSNGGFAIAGQTYVSRLPNGNLNVGFDTPSVLVVNGNGKRQWFKKYFRKVGKGLASAIAQTRNGTFLVSGYYEAGSWPFRITKKGIIEKPVIAGDISTIVYEDIVRLRDGTFIMCGSGWNMYGIRVTKVSADGKSQIWSDKYGHGTANDLAITEDGNIVVAGSLVDKNGHQAYFLKLDSHGNILWKRTPNLAGNSSLFGVYEDESEGFILTGVFKPTANESTLLVIRTDSLGQINHELVLTQR